ncbi:inositol monophosphatase family protein [Aureispira sp. CCB-E]|uniref:inositol monophosphatase family protein n=1 Tax=Aureispira sp. CCB-E TaxID=3051121 RepID=UPI002868E47C|nr:inositol monophosphatase family protein [Aureispira sp. CCB-E]WMX15679.1 inositol monophosphatase family protein [Aureispira sp. CCB-E]
MNLEKICQQTCQLSLEVGKFLQAELGKVKSQEIEHKQLNHLVSYVDKTSEQKLIDGLSQFLPDAAFLAEEETVAHEDKDWQWIIDPLDGTTNFLHQLPFFAISIALQYQKETVLGVVHEVNHQETFYSWKGAETAFLNQQKIKVSTTSTLEQSLLATGFPYYDFEQMDAYLAMIKPLMLGTRGLRRFGSAALDLAYVACGRFDGYFEYSLSPWDVAAGAFIVQQAGGLVGDFSGEQNFIYGKEIVAGNPMIYQHLIHATKKHFKPNLSA